MKHAVLSPSSSHRWLVCPGSALANVGKKESAPNAYALQGTSAHALLEVCLRLDDEPTRYLGRKLHRDHMVIDEDMADGIGYALDYVRSYVANNPATIIRPEYTVHYGKSIGTSDAKAFGTSDIILDNYPVEVVSLDYKHGIGIPVSIKDNSQLLLYLLGMRQARGSYRRYRKVVVQPRLPKRRPVQEASVTEAQLINWVDKTVRPIVPIALAPGSYRVAGEHCRYCAADGNCVAQYELVQEKAAKEFKMATKNPKGLTPEQIGKMLLTLATLEQIGASVRERAIELVHSGVEVPGYEADTTAARRIWSDEERANNALERMGLEKRDRYSVELLSPAQAEKVLKAKGLWPKKPRGSAAEDFTDPFTKANILDYTDTKPTIRRVG